MDKVEDLIAIQNVDDILSVMANTPIVDDSCFFFLAGNNSSPIDIKLLKKTSASDTDVLLSKFLIEKEYKRYNAGLAIKMWINWDEIEIPPDMLSKIYQFAQYQINELVKINGKIIEFVESSGISSSLPDKEKLKLASKMKDFSERRTKSMAAEYKILKDKRKSTSLNFIRGSSTEEKILKNNLRIMVLKTHNLTVYIQVMEKIISIIEAMELIKSKLTSEYAISSYKGLKYEKCVYSFITDNIIKQKISPNFIPLIAAKSCLLSKMIPLLNPEFTSGVSSEKYNLFKQLTSIIADLKLNFIMTGTTTDGSTIAPLHDMMHVFESNPEMFRPVLFQAIYSLAVMDLFGIVHNDLHFDNILLQKLPSKICMQFKIHTNETDTYTTTLYTEYIIKFFDWDRGYVQELGDNVLLNNFSKSHQVNNTRTKQDFSQFLCGLAKYHNIWRMVTDLFKKSGRPIPNDVNFYMFGSKTEQRGTIEIRDKSDIAKILKYFEEDPRIYYEGAIKWVEVPVTFIEMIRGLKKAFTTMYQRKPLEAFEKLYVGIEVMPDKVTIHFSPGWYCQSLFDISDSVLLPASKIIREVAFLEEFADNTELCFINKRRTGIIEQKYTFPLHKPALIVKNCTYTL